MILGEIRKILRNRVFIVMLASIFAANIVGILYCAETKKDSYYDLKQEEQRQYIETYQNYLDQMESRGEDVLAALEDESAFLSRNVEKTVRDYNEVMSTGVIIDEEYNVGVEEYAGYNYGIFFSIIFAFACLEYLYFFEKRTGSIHILRTTKNGKQQMILSKWLVYLWLVSAFAFLQEVVTACLYCVIYSFGNLNASIQSLPVFRDCPHVYSMLQGIVATVFHRVILSAVIGSLIFFCGIVCSRMITAIVIPCVIFVTQYVFSVTVSVNSSQDILCCLNIFHSWNMKNYIGVYHNLNIFGFPIEKNAAVSAANILLLTAAIIIGTFVFSVRYQSEYIGHDFKIAAFLRKQLSKALHCRRIFVNELYKLFFQQKKLVLLVVLIAIAIHSVGEYLPRNLYQRADEATYHMYLSHIQGEMNEASELFIRNEQAYISSLEEQLERATKEGDEGTALILSTELQYRQEAFERLNAQREKLMANPNVNRYWVDEMNLNTIWRKYDRDVRLFMVSAVILILLVSGLFASEKENRIFHLIYSTKNGREKLLRSKLQCSIFLSILLFTLTQLPSWIGYTHILPAECLAQRLDLLYEPAMSSGVTLLCLLMLIYFLKLLLYAAIVLITILMARRTKNEFITSVFMSTVVMIVCLVMYFLKTNLSTIVISLM